MLQLTYISTAQAGTGEDAARQILATSCRNNAAVAVSGLLIFDGRRFLQALEGPEPEVRTIFARIAADPRHRSIVSLSDRRIEQRQFGSWAMAWRRAGEAPGANSVPEAVDALVADVPDANIRALFSSFARIRRAA